MGHVAENGLSFVETSALDASNVESAFQNILTGTVDYRRQSLITHLTSFSSNMTEIYHVVCNNSIERNENQVKPPGQTINVTPSMDASSQNGKTGCC